MTAAHKRGRGRPRTPPATHHTATIEISITPELRRLVERASGHPRHGAITGWVTRAIEAALGRAEAERVAWRLGYKTGMADAERTVRKALKHERSKGPPAEGGYHRPVSGAEMLRRIGTLSPETSALLLAQFDEDPVEPAAQSKAVRGEPQWFTVEVCAPLPRERWAELGRCWTGWVGLDPAEAFPPYVACIDGAWLPAGMGPARPTGRAGAVALAEAYEDAGFRARIRCDEAPTL